MTRVYNASNSFPSSSLIGKEKNLIRSIKEVIRNKYSPIVNLINWFNKSFVSAPGLRGVGWAQMFSTIAVGTYYCSLMSITLYYLIGSFQSQLPWSTCLKEWGDSCIDSAGSYNISQKNGTELITSAELYFR